MQIKIGRRQKTTIILAILLLSLNFALRYGIGREMRQLNSEKTNYEKLALAHKLGGQSGIDYQLGIIAKYSRSAVGFVNKASVQIKNAKDIELFLQSAMREDRQKISRLRTSRTLVSAAIFLILAGRIILNIIYWLHDNKDAVSVYLQKYRKLDEKK